MTVTSGPTLEQVAAVAGVSRATVSRVVNGHSTVDPQLRERVERAVEALHYVPNRAARSLVTRRTDAVALVVSEPETRLFGDPFFTDIVRGVSAELEAAGVTLTLMLAQSWPQLDRIERYLRSAPVDGVLLISEHSTHDPLPRAMVQSGVPVVIGGRPLEDVAGVAWVDNDNVGGARQAAQHLLARGCDVVATVAGPADMAAGMDRLEGFRRGLGRHFRAAHVERGAFTIESGEAATARLLERVPGLDGLFAANDLMAVGALNALRAAGRRVPDDVAVVGFDDVPLAAHTEPPLTTLRQQTVLQGRLMARMLLSRTRPGEPVEPPPSDGDASGPAGLPELPKVDGVGQVTLPVELVIRASA